jgi:protocatechuate 3,4-dioxygenase beta subunit
MRLVILASFYLLLAGGSAAQITPSAKQSLCTVSGQVVQEPGGMPLRKVVVSLAPAEGGFEAERGSLGPNAAVTDAEGHFRIEGAQPGNYRISLDRNGFVAPNHRSRVYSSASLSLTAGQETTGLLLRMQPAGVVQGTIVDEEGDPVSGVQVVVMSPTSQNAFGGGQTNDVGEYRIGSLTRGEYLVLAQTSQIPVINGARPHEPRVFALTYYPGTVDRHQAAKVEVHPGEEAGASFNLISSRTFTVRGSVSGLAPPSRSVNLRAGVQTVTLSVDREGQQFQGSILPNETFEISGVLPGLYRARVIAQRAGVWQTIHTSQTVEVRSADVEGLQLAADPASEVRGRFRMDRENDQKPDWSQVNIQIDPDERYESEGPVVGKVATDGSFNVEVPAGNYHVVVTSNFNLAAWRDFIVKEVNLNGKDVGDSGFPVTGGMVSLEIVASAEGGAIEGNVLDEDGKPAPDVPVVCVPDAPRRTRRDIYQQVQTDRQGHFALRGLNPGEYQVFTLEDTAEDITDPEFVRAHEALGQTVKLEPGERKGIVVETVSRE